MTRDSTSLQALPLEDRYGRVARDLRVSLTDRCNLRCTYCMPAEGLEWFPTAETLDDEETLRLIRIAVEDLGIRQVRFTGGEPLLRRSLEDIVAGTKRLRTDDGTAPQTAITTPEHSRRLPRRDRHAGVLRGIQGALDAGLTPVKINTVIMPGINDHDIVSLAAFALERGLELRFIEQMPLGPPDQWDRTRMVTAEYILADLRTRFELTPAAEPRGSAPAAVWNAIDREAPQVTGRIGVIASVSHPFCGTCDRTRLTTDGSVRNCLFAREETSLRDLMRSGATDSELADAWRAVMWAKLPGHGIDEPSFIQPDRPMSAIGG